MEVTRQDVLSTMAKLQTQDNAVESSKYISKTLHYFYLLLQAILNSGDPFSYRRCRQTLFYFLDELRILVDKFRRRHTPFPLLGF